MSRDNGVGGPRNYRYPPIEKSSPAELSATDTRKSDQQQKTQPEPAVVDEPVIPSADRPVQASSARISERKVSPDQSNNWAGMSWLSNLRQSSKIEGGTTPELAQWTGLVDRSARSVPDSHQGTRTVTILPPQLERADGDQEKKITKASQQLIAAYARVEPQSSPVAPQPYFPLVSLVNSPIKWQELELGEEGQCYNKSCPHVQRLGELESEVERLKILLDERDKDCQVLQAQIDQAKQDKSELEQTLKEINSQLIVSLPKAERPQLTSPRDTVKLLTTQTQYSLAGRELMLAMGVDKKTEDLPVEVLVNKLVTLQEAKVKQDQLTKSGIKDVTPYVDFWEKFIKTFDPTVKPSAIEPEHLLPNLQAVKGDSDRLHGIIDAFRRNGWTKGDDELLSYLESLPSQIKQSKTK